MTKQFIPPLTTVYFYLTEGCNLACKHCWLSPPLEKGKLKYPYLPLSQIQAVINEARPLGLQSVKLTGGEPFLHPDIKSILEQLREEKIPISIETNGTLFTQELVSQLAQMHDVFISVSLDSISASKHENVRKIKGCFEDTVRGIKMLVESNIHPQVITSLLPENKEELPEIIRFVEELGASSFKLNIIQPTERGNNLANSGQTVGIKDILDIARNINDTFFDKSPMEISVSLPFAFRPLNLIKNGLSTRCGIMNILGVLATGEYALCGIGTSIPELVFGKVGKDSLKTLWESNSVLNDLRIGIPEKLEGICGNCTMKWICLGSCIAQNYYSKKCLTAPYWFCDEAESLGLFPASRKKTV